MTTPVIVLGGAEIVGFDSAKIDEYAGDANASKLVKECIHTGALEKALAFFSGRKASSRQPRSRFVSMIKWRLEGRAVHFGSLKFSRLLSFVLFCAVMASFFLAATNSGRSSPTAISVSLRRYR